jgi:uncharacterized ferritin-like protein (DUF455 family)
LSREGSKRLDIGKKYRHLLSATRIGKQKVELNFHARKEAAFPRQQ